MKDEIVIEGKLFVPVEHPVKVEYFRPDEGMKIYHMGRAVIYKIARDGNAFYKVNRATFIDKVAFEKELKKYLVKDTTEVNADE